MINNKKGFAFIPLLIILGVMLVLLLIFIKNPQICLFGNCFRLVPLRLGKTILFWIAFISFFLIQAGVIYVYYIALTKSMNSIQKGIKYLKDSSMKIEKYFIRLSH